MTGPPLKILVVEDSEPDYELLRATLARQGVDAHCLRVETRPQMEDALASSGWDAIISDHQLPQFSSLEALETLRASGLTLPFMIVSGTIGEDVAVEAMRAGADDYLIKGRLARLGAALQRAIGDARVRRERTQNQEALAESATRLRELSAHLQIAVEEERRAIAREIHDDVGGLLTALRFDLGWIERHAEGQVQLRARQALDTLAQAMSASQRIMRSLRPPVLEAGVVAALQWQVNQHEKRTGMKSDFHANVESVDLDEDAATTLYRTAQEALTNIVKHADARSVSIDLIVRDGQVSLEITDDGKGLLAEDLRKPGSFGLRGLAERATAAGGWLDVLPARQGTTVLLTLPVRGAQTVEEPAE